MTVNLMSLLLLMLMLCMITAAMNFLKRALLKILYFLKALLMQIPLIGKVSLQAAEMEKEAAQRKTKAGKAPEERQPKVLISQEEETETMSPETIDEEVQEWRRQREKEKQEQKQNRRQNQNPKRHPKQEQKTDQNP